MRAIECGKLRPNSESFSETSTNTPPIASARFLFADKKMGTTPLNDCYQTLAKDNPRVQGRILGFSIGNTSWKLVKTIRCRSCAQEAARPSLAESGVPWFQRW